MAQRSFLSLLVLTALSATNAYWLMGSENFITIERIDPIVNPGGVAGHAHAVLGGSNFRMSTNTASLRSSGCTSMPIPQDKSNYWFPQLYFQWKNGSFSSVDGGAVMYLNPILDYLFPDKPGTTTPFPDDFRMLTGNPTLRTYDPKNFAQQAVSFLCLDFRPEGVTTKHNSLPIGKLCPSGIRAQINFPSCWDGKNIDSPDHKSHVSFLSNGPDSGDCSDPKYPYRVPRIFLEVYWGAYFNDFVNQAMNASQPYVFAHGDPTGYGYHADFLMGWDKGVLQKAVDMCNCDPFGSPRCCADRGIFSLTQGKTCRITKSINEQTTGTLAKLPGNNPVQQEGKNARPNSDPDSPVFLSPVYTYTGATPTAVGTPVKNTAPTSAKALAVGTPSAPLPSISSSQVDYAPSPSHTASAAQSPKPVASEHPPVVVGTAPKVPSGGTCKSRRDLHKPDQVRRVEIHHPAHGHHDKLMRRHSNNPGF